jgi:hypothetical protein
MVMKRARVIEALRGRVLFDAQPRGAKLFTAYAFASQQHETTWIGNGISNSWARIASQRDRERNGGSGSRCRRHSGSGQPIGPESADSAMRHAARRPDERRAFQLRGGALLGWSIDACVSRWLGRLEFAILCGGDKPWRQNDRWRHSCWNK